MFPLITGSPLAGRCTATHCIVVPSESCTCQAANLTEIESEQSARNILKSCMTGDYIFSHFCRISDSKIDCIRGTLTPVSPCIRTPLSDGSEAAAAAGATRWPGRRSEMSSDHRAAQLERQARVAQLERRVHTAAIDGLEQGLGYLLTKRLDLTGESFGAMDEEELLRIARRCPELEALFVSEGGAMDQRLADTLRRGPDAPCPRLRCACLGQEISEAAFVALEEQYTRSDVDLGAAIPAAALSLPGEQPAVPPAPFKALDLTGEDFSRLTDDGLREIAEFCTGTTALFLGASTRVSQAGLDAFRERCAGVRVVHLGREIFPATALVNLLDSFAETKRLNLTEFTLLSARGLREILSLCPEVTALFTTADDKITPQELADISASCPAAQCMLLGREVDEPTFDALHAQYEGSKMLDLAGPEFSRLTAAGLSELAGLF
eukprot:COSAG05_NODE_390_length_10436_cov_15.721196_12_plen_436_part_01